MLRSVRLCCFALGLLSLTAHAEPVPFEDGRLALQFGPLYGLQVPPSTASAATGTADVQSTAGGVITRIQIPAGVFVADAVSIPFDGPTEMGYIPPVGGVRLTFANQAGTFSRVATASGDRLQGAMPLAGVHKFCVFYVACGATPSANISVPLSVIGQGGTAKATGLPSVTLRGDTWSTGSVTIDGPNQQTGMITGTLQAGSNGTQVRLVTPVFLSTNTAGTIEPPFRGVGVLTFLLKPAPEPGLAALLGTAAITLAGLGWHRARTRKSGRTS
jgi:hypothetical protein